MPIITLPAPDRMTRIGPPQGRRMAIGEIRNLICGKRATTYVLRPGLGLDEGVRGTRLRSSTRLASSAVLLFWLQRACRGQTHQPMLCRRGGGPPVELPGLILPPCMFREGQFGAVVERRRAGSIDELSVAGERVIGNLDVAGPAGSRAAVAARHGRLYDSCLPDYEPLVRQLVDAGGRAAPSSHERTRIPPFDPRRSYFGPLEPLLVCRPTPVRRRSQKPVLW